MLYNYIRKNVFIHKIKYGKCPSFYLGVCSERVDYIIIIIIIIINIIIIIISIYCNSSFHYVFNQQLGSKTTNEQLHCLCNHLSAFGGSIFVAPNPIDFDTVFIKFAKLGETKNVVVLATVCVIIGIYFIGLVFARRADKNDNFKVSVNFLSF